MILKYLVFLSLLIPTAHAANQSADNFLAYQSFQCFDPANRTRKVTIQAPTLGASWALTLPTTDGGANEFLQTNGSGVTTWAVPTDTGITQLTGDVTAGPGSGSQAATLATVNSDIGSFTNASVTVNGKGLVTAASSGSAPVTTLGAFGSSPNGNAATISGNTLTLQPADATNPGGVSTTTQEFAGAKTFSAPLTINGTTANQDIFVINPTSGGDWAIGTQGNSAYWAQGAVVPFWFAAGWTAMGNATRTPKYLVDMMESAASTDPLTDIVYNSGIYNLPLFVATNKSGTTNDYSGFCTAGSSTSSSSPDMCLLGIHTDNTGGSEDANAQLQLKTNGIWNTRFSLTNAGALTLSGYGAGVAQFDSSGVVSSTAPGTSGNVLTSNGSAWTSAAAVDTGITQLTGDVTAGPGSGSQAATLATVNSNVGSFTNANITVNAKGLITAAANGSGGSGSAYVRTFSLGYGTTNAQTGCSSSPCTLIDQIDSDGNTDTVSSISRAGTGEYTLNITSGRCSAVPACSFIQSRACLGSSAAAYNNSATPTSTAVPFVTDTTAGTNGCGFIQCTCKK